MLPLTLAALLAAAANAATPRELDAQVYGFNIHYTEAGSGPTILLLHGLWGGTNEWQPVLEPLARRHRVIAMDFLGFHGSDKPNAEYHNALLSQFLTGFIETLGLQDVTLMGHAMGANTATYTAYHHPQHISRLILIDGAGYRKPARNVSEPQSDAMLQFRRVATGSSLSATRSLLQRRVLDDSMITEERVEEAFRLWLNSARAIGDMLLEGGDVGEDEMRQIKVPTLIVWGADDEVFPIRNAHRLQADIEGAELRIIENSGHLPHMERTSAFLDVVLPFLQQKRD